MKTTMLTAALTTFLIAGLSITCAQAAITVKDDGGQTVTVAKPALRIISLAPSVTELLFAAGGGSRVVGAVNYSDYPEANKESFADIIAKAPEMDLETLVQYIDAENLLPKPRKSVVEALAARLDELENPEA